MRARDAYAAQYEALAGLVRVCSVCEGSAPFKGFDQAHAAGWRWTLGVGRIVWCCADCRPTS